MEAHLARAIETAKAGHQDQARDLLIFILNEEPRNITAWKWFATVAASEEEARQAIYNILRLDPRDEWARAALKTLDARRSRRPGRRKRGTLPATAALLGLGGLALCGVVVALLIVVLGIGAGVLAVTVNETVSTPAPLTRGDAALNPPTLPPSWTPSAMPLPPPTATPAAAPPATATSVPTPAALDVPVQSEIERVPLDAPPVESGPIIETQSVQYYAVTGSDAQQINQSIVDNGPKNGGQDAIAQVQYTTALHYSLQQSGGACAAEQAVVYLTLEFLYPQYNPPPGVPQALLDQWDAFMQRVVAHEEAHAQIARECALKMVEAFYTLQPAPTCPALRDNLAAMQSSLDAECNMRQVAFDEAEGGDSFP